MDDFIWLAHLDNGETYAEHDERGNERGWKSVPHERVVALELVPVQPDVAGLCIAIAPEQTPVCFRRRFATVRTDGVIAGTRTVTVIGYESDAGDRYWAVEANGDNRTVRDQAEIQ